MINFCTLFDSNYLARGLALYASLQRTCPAFHLYVVTFDEPCYDYLLQSKLSNLTPIRLRDFEDEELLRVKPTRSVAEYCWTCTPSIILYCINTYRLPSCIYIDADMIFYQDPQVLLDEMEGHSIIITEHRYPKEYNAFTTHGIYCVQFMYFKNNSAGLTALTWWRERCIEWCYSYLEDGKFGDQKYLDDWPTRFEGVHVLKHPGGGVAPWNVQLFDPGGTEHEISLTQKDGRSFPLVFYHFHALKFYTNDKVSCCGTLFEINSKAKLLIYLPYIKTLLRIEDAIKQQGTISNPNGRRSIAPGKSTVFFQFLKELTTLITQGKLPLAVLSKFSFSKHYHFYNLNNLR